MTLIDTATAGPIDASSLVEAYAFTQTSAAPALVLAQVRLSGVVGGGVYTLRIALDGILFTPVSTFSVPSGVINFIALSREFIMTTGQEVTIEVMGQPGDTAITAIVSLYDVTPVAATQVGGGGSTPVDHNFPNTGDMLILLSDDTPVIGACIYIYTQADYTAGNTEPQYVIGQSVTTNGGAWKYPISLDAGSYVAYVFKQGVMSATTLNFVVP
jgi:hypothetical protein